MEKYYRHFKGNLYRLIGIAKGSLMRTIMFLKGIERHCATNSSHSMNLHSVERLSSYSGSSINRCPQTVQA